MTFPSFEPGVTIPALAAIISSAVTGYFTFLAARHKAKPEQQHAESDVADRQALLNASFNTLVDQLQEERASYLRIIEEQGVDIKAHIETTRVLTIALNEVRSLLAAHGIKQET